MGWLTSSGWVSRGLFVAVFVFRRSQTHLQRYSRNSDMASSAPIPQEADRCAALFRCSRSFGAKSGGVLGWLLFCAYAWSLLRPAVGWFLRRTEGGMTHSVTLRRIFRHYYKVAVGPFSYGPGLKPGVFDPGCILGSFCSIAAGLQVLRRNHPTSWVCQPPLFFGRQMGLVDSDRIALAESNPLRIGNDVWIGSNVIICAGCRLIVDGAIIGAGSVATKDVRPFTLVATNPAKPIRKRFSPEVEAVVAVS